ncbi:MAG: phenylalanine--tRNA ligase subunit beta [Candidatus Nanoarchaeia archaeon]|nr:phenylalanine--tRNA ligase subunit beta [Candidatus Nanoarchaeia archaeon]MDD5239116.1 phenylalanine--tRNA ligase subunit beta [Candidatus Nanoarchaeia archaeon]
MPVATVSKKEIEKFVGKSLDRETLAETIWMYLKADIEEENGDEITFKFEDTNRPDLWSAEGIGRELRNILGLHKGYTSYKVNKSNFTVNVDDSKLKEIRPFIACAVVKDIEFDDAAIKSIMQIQDKLDQNYGRKRKKTSIGIYDYDRIKPPVLYTTVEPNSKKFVPLGFTAPMTPKEILEKHPKGVEYADILKKFSEYPLLIDSEDNILSMPPVINSNHLGKVDRSTKNVLVEVTGTSEDAVKNVLNLVSSALAERGGDIYSVKIVHKQGRKEDITPNLGPLPFKINPSYVKQRIGIDISLRDMKHILEKMGYNIVHENTQEDIIEVEASFYRKDIMHQVDIAEDIAIGYGFNNILPAEIKVPTIGKLDDLTIKSNLYRDVIIGLGFQEILNFVLTSKDLLFAKMNLPECEVVELANPVSSSWDVMRNSLLPIHLNFLAQNKTVEFPQKIFEVGDIVLPDSSAENATKQTRLLCAAITHPRANYTEIKAVLDKLMHDMNLSFTVKEHENSSYIPGRCGIIEVNNKTVGIIGEVHPQVLQNFTLENPVVAFQIHIDWL